MHNNVEMGVSMGKEDRHLENKCIVEFACSKIWDGEEPCHWIKVIKTHRHLFTPDEKLASKIKIALILGLIYLNKENVRRGNTTFANPQMFLTEFLQTNRLLRISTMRRDPMEVKVIPWVWKTDLTEDDCQGYVDELKEFYKTRFEKAHNKDLFDAANVHFEKTRINSKLKAGTLRNVFLMKYRGNIAVGLHEWKQIVHDTHPKVVELKGKLAQKVSLKQANDQQRHSELATLKTCSVQLADIKDTPLFSEFIKAPSQGKEAPFAISKSPRKETRLIPDFSSENSGDELADIDTCINNESSEDLISPTPEENKRANLSLSLLGKKRKTLTKTKNYTVTRADQEYPASSDEDSAIEGICEKKKHSSGHASRTHQSKEPDSSKASGSMESYPNEHKQNAFTGITLRKKQPQNNGNCSKSKTTTNHATVTSDDDSDVTVEHDSSTSSGEGQFQRGDNTKGHKSHSNNMSKQISGAKKEVGEKRTKTLHSGKSLSAPSESILDNIESDMAEKVKNVAHNLEEASRNLMTVVKDPYPSSSGNTPAETLSRKIPKSRQKFNEPQSDAEQLTWSDFDEDMPRQIELPAIEPKKSLLFANQQNKSKKHVRRKRVQRRVFWNEEETKELKRGIALYGFQWSLIKQNCQLPRRSAENIKDRFRTLGADFFFNGNKVDVEEDEEEEDE